MNEEIESMDVDPQEDPSINQQGQKRALDATSVQDTSQTTTTKYSYQRKISKAKRKLSPSFVLVIDTNVLLADLRNLELVINEENAGLKSNLSVDIQKFLIPWTVINELDGLKNSGNNGPNARKAIKFINAQLKSEKKILICLDEDQESRMVTSDHDPASAPSNDDRILQCCLSLKQPKNREKFGVSLSSSVTKIIKIILITNDINLQNKSMIFKVESYGFKEFICKYSDKLETIRPISSRTLDEVDENVIQNPVGSNKKLKKSINTSTSFLPDIDCGKSIEAKSSSSKSSSDIETHYLLENRLSRFLVDVFKQTYGERMWRKILGDHYHPENAALIDSLRKFKSNWVGLISDYFDRNQKVLNLVQIMLASASQMKEENYSKLLKFIDSARMKLEKQSTWKK